MAQKPSESVTWCSHAADKCRCCIRERAKVQAGLVLMWEQKRKKNKPPPTSILNVRFKSGRSSQRPTQRRCVSARHIITDVSSSDYKHINKWSHNTDPPLLHHLHRSAEESIGKAGDKPNPDPPTGPRRWNKTCKLGPRSEINEAI